jgi:hypothetical protein
MLSNNSQSVHPIETCTWSGVGVSHCINDGCAPHGSCRRRSRSVLCGRLGTDLPVIDYDSFFLRTTMLLPQHGLLGLIEGFKPMAPTGQVCEAQDSSCRLASTAVSGAGAPRSAG